MAKPRLSFLRGLRFRLTLANGIFLVGLLVFLGLFFRGVLSLILDNQIRDILDEEWYAVKGYLIIHRGEPEWRYDPEDREEELIVKRMQQVFFLADAKGRKITASETFLDLGLVAEPDVVAALASKQPYWLEKRSSAGELFRIRGGMFVDDDNKAYFVAIGRSKAASEAILAEFTRDYQRLLPAFILSGCLLGWLVAGRAIRPVHELARTAERVSGDNLSLRIPSRGSGDELDNLIRTFNSMVERLESSFQMTRQFNADVSHELRTPLTAIRGQLEVALFTAKTKEQYREAMINALEDVERLSQTVRAMLLLSQAEGGQLALQRTVFDLAEVTRDIVDEFQIPAEEARVEVVCESDSAVGIEADRIQIERLLNNLLSNAVKYTPSGGKVVARVNSRGEEVVLEVEDTGMGIGADHLPHIFDRFYRVPGASKEKQGLGLGLSFVAWIVKAHGGSIQADSAVGKGTRFTIVIPAGARAGAQEATSPALQRS
ncbi:MAG: HAMP domain-containing protein [Bryobacterales bacterium]|nr:HAMP domain-containing protein [Bryobacterales bacterium]